MKSFDLQQLGLDVVTMIVILSNAIHFANMHKSVKILYIMILILFPYFHNYFTNFLNYGVGILHWIVAIKCLKSFNYSTSNFYDNIVWCYKNYRLKGYSPKKSYELKKNIHYVSPISDILVLMGKYFIIYCSMLTAIHYFPRFFHNNRIESLYGYMYMCNRFVYAIVFGVLISTAIQLVSLVASLFYILHAKAVLVAYNWTLNGNSDQENPTEVQQCLLTIYRETVDQRPYLIFDKPILVKSVSTFWSESWHTILREIFIVFPVDVYRKSTPLIKSLISFSAFICSGIFHDYLIVICSHTVSYSSLIFFLCQGVAVLIEYCVFKVFPRRSFFGKLFGIVFGNLVLTLTPPYFVEPVRNLYIFEELFYFFVPRLFYLDNYFKNFK